MTTTVTPPTPPLERHHSVVTLDHDVARLVVKSDLANITTHATLGDQKEELKENLEGFEKHYQHFVDMRKGKLGIVDWNKVQPPPQGAVKSYESIDQVPDAVAKDLLDKLVILKLNGGRGITMGVAGPKSLISVRNDTTFLDLIVLQVEHMNRRYGTDVPLVLMNSFNTHSDTERIKFKYGNRVTLLTFQQSYHPRILLETLRPYPENFDLHDGRWYPPGHGDVYVSLKKSGMLEKLLDQGKEYIFISNIDNLGATVDLGILNLLESRKGPNPCEIVMEVTERTRSDVTGGILVHYEDKSERSSPQLRLLELGQVPKKHTDDFRSIKKFKVFNTNNLWANLQAMDRLLSSGKMDLDVLINRKILDDGVTVIQLETAAGSAIKSFGGAIGINVPRSRFLPVKTTSDLLLLKSNLFTMAYGAVRMNPARTYAPLPVVKLGEQHFQKLGEFLGRFDSIPDMLELDHLTVSGDVTFGRKVTLKGTVIIIANHGDKIDIPAGACLENKIVSGNLRILDH